jgi:hypothetical protein
MVGVSYNLIQI